MNLSLPKLLASAALVLGSTAAMGAPVLQQDVRVNTATHASHVFVQGTPINAAGLAATATDAQMMWYDRASATAVSAVGGGANVALNGVVQFRVNTVPDVKVVRTNLSSVALAQTSWNIDLGSRLLDSNVADYGVTGSSIRVIDFGNAGNADLWFDFQVGLWNGSELMLASAMDQVNFGLMAPTALNQGQVQYLGNNLFRFLETGKGGSGSTLTISSATDGYFVRTLKSQGMYVSNNTAFTDGVDFAGSRTLQANEVPEPTSALLMGIGLVALARRRPRSALASTKS